jgi:hypothetical protein
MQDYDINLKQLLKRPGGSLIRSLTGLEVVTWRDAANKPAFAILNAHSTTSTTLSIRK